MTVIKVLEKAFLDIANNPDVRAQMKIDGFVPVTMGHEAAKGYIEEKVKVWGPVVKEFKK